MLNNNRLASAETTPLDQNAANLQTSPTSQTKTKSVSVAEVISYAYLNENFEIMPNINNNSPSKSSVSVVSNKSSPTKSPLKSIPVSPSSSNYNLKSPRRGGDFRIQIENDYKSKATRNITNDELEQLSKQGENNFVENFLKKIAEKEKAKNKRPPPHPNSSNHRIKSFYFDPQDGSSISSKRSGSAKSNTPSTTSRSTSATSSKQQSYYYYYNIRPTSSIKTTQSQLSAQNYQLTAIPERQIKSAPATSSLVPVRVPDDGIRKDSRYFNRSKIHYVDMSIDYENQQEGDSLSQLSNPTIFENKEKLEAAALKIKNKLKQINDEEIIEAANQKRKMSNIDKLSILRERRPTIIQSMSVEKWIEVHKRQNRQTALDFLNKNIVVLDPKESQSYVQKKMDKPESKSRRELADNTLLDKVQKQVKTELQQTLKKIKRVETNNEFNSLVDKIRNFLYKWEEEYGGPGEVLSNIDNSRSSKKSLKNYKDDCDDDKGKNGFEENKKTIIPLCYKNLQDNRSLNQNFQQLGYTR